MKTKNVNKKNYEIFEFANGYYGICLKGGMGGSPIFGADPANEDDYNYDYIKMVYDEWEGRLVYHEYFGYVIDRNY